MKLFATGLNAWGQLSFQSGANEPHPDDVYEFIEVLDRREIKPPVARLAYTLVACDGMIQAAGFLPKAIDTDSGRRFLYGAAEASNGRILARPESATLGAHGDRQDLCLLPSLESWSRGAVSESVPGTVAPRQIAAYDTGFLVLQSNGTVWSMGDPRYEACLGRPASDATEAEALRPIQDLCDLGDPVTQISAGGYTAAAVTESGGLYAWGMGSPVPNGRRQAIDGLEGVPNYIEIGEDIDVECVGVGETHIVALTRSGRIFVIGGNENGQLGLGRGAPARVESWCRLDFEPPPAHRILGVYAGPHCSFILTSE